MVPFKSTHITSLKKSPYSTLNPKKVTYTATKFGVWGPKAHFFGLGGPGKGRISARFSGLIVRL